MESGSNKGFRRLDVSGLGLITESVSDISLAFKTRDIPQDVFKSGLVSRARLWLSLVQLGP